MENFCGADCAGCSFKDNCKGCMTTGGMPFGKPCIAAKYIKNGGKEAFAGFKEKLIDEINALHINGMAKVNALYCLCGFFVNLEYPLPSGEKAKLIDDNKIYLGCQLESKNSDSCFGVVADDDFILICTYGENGSNPELVMYKKR